jgi:hypothetical protein
MSDRNLGTCTWTPRSNICAHCSKEIVFSPHCLDGRDPNPPTWWHRRSGAITCSVSVAKSPWPVATPMKADRYRLELHQHTEVVRFEMPPLPYGVKWRIVAVPVKEEE